MPTVYFYCRDEPGNLQEDVITLAEGLDALGIRHYSNVDYWQRSTASGDYLLRHDPNVTPDDCDIVVVSYTWPSWTRPRTFESTERPLPAGLFKAGRRYRTVYMDHHDGHRTVSWGAEFRQFDLILRIKLNQRAWHPGNMRPWAVALNQRIIQATANPLPWAERKRRIAVNFGASHPYPHGVRDLARARFDPKIAGMLEIDRTTDDLSQAPADPFDALMWTQTGARFSRAYYDRLRSCQAVSCFCGDLIPPSPFQSPEQYLTHGRRARLRRMWYDWLARFDSRPPRWVQWDSFRFWEALSAGCVAFNLDLEHYGATIPVMPTNWVHYIGVDLERIDDAIDRLTADPGMLERIAASGRQWAFEHYSPQAAARRFLAWALA